MLVKIEVRRPTSCHRTGESFIGNYAVSLVAIEAEDLEIWLEKNVEGPYSYHYSFYGPDEAPKMFNRIWAVFETETDAMLCKMALS